jgi:hypothetical protein
MTLESPSAVLLETLKQQRYETLLAPVFTAMQTACAAMDAAPRIFLVHPWAETPVEDEHLLARILLLTQFISRSGGRAVSALTDWKVEEKEDASIFDMARAAQAAQGEERAAAQVQLHERLERSYGAFCRREMGHSRVAMAAASPSFKRLAEDSKTNPVSLALAVASEKSLEALPVVLVGQFQEAVPASLAGVLGAALSSTDAFYEHAPRLIATGLGVGDNTQVQDSLATYAQVKENDSRG